MYGKIGSTANLLGAFQMTEVAMRYSEFIPKVVNLCNTLGFTPGEIMPSRAFCSDESQGYPAILIAKHFGAFPFNHGRVGGTISVDRHGPHAHHGKDLVIIHASHVGYDAESKSFGVYRRLQAKNQAQTTSCGKICGALDWYIKEYKFAKKNISLSRENGEYQITIDNLLLHEDRDEGLMLNLDHLIGRSSTGEILALKSLSTSKVFPASSQLIESLDSACYENNEVLPIGKYLKPEMFSFKRLSNDQMNRNLIGAMPYIVSDKWPALKAAQVNTQVEFDRAFRSIILEPEYQGKRLLFISGLNVDISPKIGQIFPLTKFIPWAAYYQTTDGKQETWEQAELYERIKSQSVKNPNQVDLEDVINEMEMAEEIKLPF